MISFHKKSNFQEKRMNKRRDFTAKKGVDEARRSKKQKERKQI